MKNRGIKRQLIGMVVSDKMDKTIVVQVERLKRHTRYGKVLRFHKKYKAHDADNACEIGDLVEMAEARPLSREKRWVVTQILERA